jgi:hypothetical protein
VEKKQCPYWYLNQVTLLTRVMWLSKFRTFMISSQNCVAASSIKSPQPDFRKTGQGEGQLR